MKTCWTWLLGLFIGLPLLLMAEDVALGDTEERVLSVMGKPTARVAAGGAVLLTFPRGTVRIANGVVTSLDLESAEAHQKRMGDLAVRRAAAEREQYERNRLRVEEGLRIRGERESDAAFQALPARQRLAFWRQFMNRFPGVAPGSDFTTAALQVQAEDEQRRLALAEERRLRELEDRVARAEERANEAERDLERHEQRWGYNSYYGYPYNYAPIVPVTPRPKPRPCDTGPTILVNGFEQFESSSSRHRSVGFGVRSPAK